MKKALAIITALIIGMSLQVISKTTAKAAQLPISTTTSRASVDPKLEAYLSTQVLGGTAPAVITYDRKPAATELGRLQAIGIKKGFALRELPMVMVDLTKSQLASVRTQPGVRSIYANRVMKSFTNASRQFIGVPQMTADREVTTRNTTNPGLPITGKGVGIGYIDTGIDGTHKDLEFGPGKKTVQNVIQPLSETTIGDGGLLIGVGIAIGDLLYEAGFAPPIYIENQPHSDVESGHGTHGAAVAAGTGEMSGGFYGGVARGAHVVGVNSGNELGLPLVAIIGAYDYLLSNQYLHNIRVINNSWGSSLDAGGLDPFNPINVATRACHDRNIVVVFAAGNAGDTPTSINPYSTMPWTISVAAGEKQGLGTPADFSSRGVNNGDGTDVAGMPADPNARPNLRPDITAPGVDIKSARMKGVGLTNTLGTVPLLGNDLTTIAPAFLPFYTTSQGTSFACPHVSGVVALLLEANPRLTPDEVVTILRSTATPMPYDERVVGAGYVDAHNAVRKVMNLSAVAHPANLFPDQTGPEIVDGADDQTGTTAQDIRSCDFAYDSTTREIVYTLTLADLSSPLPNSQWTIASNFGATAVFVSAAVTETGETTFDYGTITALPNGTPNQDTIGPADSGEISGNSIIMRLSVDKVNAAVGSDVVGTTSTAVNAKAQILIGTSVTGGLLLNSDSAAGRDFKVESSSGTTGSTGGGGTGGGTEPEPTAFTERLVGTLTVGQGSATVPVTIRLSTLDTLLTYHPANTAITIELVNSAGNVVATGDQSSDKSMQLGNLPAGNYTFRVSGAPNKNVDFVIKSQQLTAPQ